jgi:hypothetical protein
VLDPMDCLDADGGELAGLPVVAEQPGVNLLHALQTG